jgi:hypothetical protein
MGFITENEKIVLSYLYDNKQKILDYDLVFYSQEAKTIHSILIDLTKENIDFNSQIILSRDENNLLNENILESIVQTKVEEQTVQSAVRLIKDAVLKKSLNSILQNDLLEALLKKEEIGTERIQGIVNIIQNKLDGSTNINNNKLITAQTWLHDYTVDLSMRERGRYNFGDSFLDARLMAGPIPGTITTLFGPTGGGKSSYALHLVNRCLNRVVACVYDTLEMDKDSTMDRLMSTRLQFPMSSLYPVHGAVDEHLQDRIQSEKKSFEYFRNFFLIDTPDQKIDDIKWICKEAKKKFKQDWFIFFADLYSMFKDHGRDPKEIEDGMNRLHSIVKQERIHFVAVVQANRDNEGQKPSDPYDTDKFRPTLKNIKNSGAYAERSRIVLSAFKIGRAHV